MSKRVISCLSVLILVLACAWSSSPSLAEETAVPLQAKAAAVSGYEVVAGSDAQRKDVAPTFTAQNPANGLRLEFTSTGLRGSPLAASASPWAFTLFPERAGSGAASQALVAPQLSGTGNSVVYDFGGISVRYTNSPEALQQVITFPGPGIGASADRRVVLAMEFGVAGSLTPTTDAYFVNLVAPDGKTSLRYGAVRAFDANGTPLDAGIVVRNDDNGKPTGVRIIVNAISPAYPVTVSSALRTKGPQPTTSAATKGEITGNTVTMGAVATESVADIMEREAAAAPATEVVHRPEFEAELDLVDNPDAPAVSQWPPLSNFAAQPPAPLAPQTVGANFQAIQLYNNAAAAFEAPSVPPDPMGDVGPTQILAATNGRLKVFDKAGNLGALNVSDATFWASNAPTSGVSDPEVRYDRLSGRWFVLAVDLATTNNKIMIAVSSGPTITATTDFSFFAFNASVMAGDSANFCDYPSLGIDNNAIYGGCNMFSSAGAYQHSSAYVIRKSTLLGGTLNVTGFGNITGGTAAGPYSPQGVDNDDSTWSEGYIIGTDVAILSTIQVRRVINPGSATPTLSANLTLTVPQTTNMARQWAPGIGTSTNNRIDVGDSRLMKANVHKNKLTGVTSLWTAQEIEVLSTGVASTTTTTNDFKRIGARWYEIGNLTATPSVTQSGTLFDNTTGVSTYNTRRGYIFPSVVETGQGHMALGSSYGSSTTTASEFMGAAVSGRLRTDALGTTQAATVATAGTERYRLCDGTSGACPRNRWGDYSFTDVDPNDDQTVWTFQEVAIASTSLTIGNGNWAVRAIQLMAPPPAAFATITPNSACRGLTSIPVTITGTSSAASEFFDPGSDPIPYASRIKVSGPGIFENGQPAILIPGSPSTTPVTSLTAVLNTTAATGGAKNITVTNPDGQSTTGSGVFTVGAGAQAPPTISTFLPQNNRIDVNWNDSALATVTQYFVYRATSFGGPYSLLATVGDTSPGVAGGPSYVYHDDTATTGTRYWYVVASSDGVACPSLNSNEAFAGQCLTAPTFGGVTSVTNNFNATCTQTIGWSAGTSGCNPPGTIRYNVYRSTSSGFTPSAANRIAAGVTGTSFVDSVGTVNGTTYFYVVRAVEFASGVEDTNTKQLSGAPTGVATPASWTDTFEGAQSGGGFDQAGWTHNAITGTVNWAYSTVQPHDGTHSWFAADGATVADRVLTSPVFTVGPSTTLSFWHTFAFENTFDGGTLEYTTNGGTTWTVVPTADFTAGAYSVTISASFGNPIGGKLGWTGGTVGAMTQVSVSLGVDPNIVNKPVQIRWHGGDDSSTGATGWYVDSVTISNYLVVGSCSAGSACTAPGAPSLNSATGDCAGINLSFSAGSGSTTWYDVYRSTTPGGPYTKVGAMPTASTTFSDTTAVPGITYYYVIRGACDAADVSESGNSNQLSAAQTIGGGACTDDGNPCTSDVCTNGACTHPNVTAGTACGDPSSGQCDNPDTCDGAGVCQANHVGNGTACNDGNACTQTDTCQTGVCVGGNPVVCTALDQCHDVGTCNPGTGVCSNPDKVDGTTCDDGNLCTYGDVCTAGSCGGTSITCTDNQCNFVSCNGTSTCSVTPKTNGTACNDGNACTQTDACSSGVCVGTNPVICNDNNSCTDDACNPGTGMCVYVANDGNSCTDGNICTNDACSGGTCVNTANGACGASGSVFYYRTNVSPGTEPTTKPVPSVGIDSNGDAVANATTDGTGGYSIPNLAGHVTLAPLAKYGSPRASDHNGAITSLDASLIARTAVGAASMSPNQRLAGDVTGNGTLTGLDASQVARFAAELVDHFDVAVSTGSDWKFLRCDAYAYPGDPGCGAALYDYNPITGPVTGQNFYALLYGEVTGNWQPAAAFAALSSRGTSLEEQAAFKADQLVASQIREANRAQVVRAAGAAPADLTVSGWTLPLRPGERRTLTINLRDAEGILALDLALKYDPSRIAVVDVASTGIGSGLNVAHADQKGTHKISAYGVLPLSGSGSVLTVTIQALKGSVPQMPLTISGSANEGQIPLQVGTQKEHAPTLNR